jgi:hypothetical protein
MNSAASASTVVCVLGMSRTGTSLTTRVLSLAGVYLGPEDELLQKDLHQLEGEGESVLARARDTNPEGFWEHYRLMRLNERILRRLGGSWREPPEMPPGWETSEALAPERAEARALIDESFRGHDLWAWKDPRNCLTLPFWQRLLPEMRYVICVRNPVDVAASLQRRDEISFEQSVSLWLAYVSHALINTSGKPRLFVSYEDFFDAPEVTAASLAAFVGREGVLEGTDGCGKLGEVVDERLWRHRTSAGDVGRDPRIPVEVAALHQLTNQLSALSAVQPRAPVLP